MRFLALPLLAAQSALAAGVSLDSVTGVEVLGWTRDSKVFVYRAHSFMESGEDLDAEHADVGLYDVATDQVRALDPEQTFAKWKTANPLAPIETGRSGAGGKATADVKSLPGRGGKWNDSGFAPSDPAGAELVVERDGHTWVSVLWAGGVHTVQPYWSPDGRKVAWLIHPRDWQNMGCGECSDYQLLFGPAGLPRVHVVAAKALLAKVAPGVKAALDGKGFFTTYVGKALKERDASVVYAAPGMEELAKKAAALIPGGATVDKLSWKVSAELVVALGSKAAAAGAP